MFRRIVSNLAFSPALVGQLSFYAKRLKKEELTRRLGLVFTVMALVVQSLAVFSPPEAANASSSADFVRGGISSKPEFLRYYDSNHNNIRSIFNSLGITRDEIERTGTTVIGESSRYNWSKTSLYSHAQGQRSWGSGASKAFYRPMRLTQQGGDRHEVFAGQSKTQGWFAIKKDCGNLITEKPPVKPEPPKPPTPPKPQPKPAAACRAVGASLVDRTIVELSGSATTSDGARISSYIFEIRDSRGRVVSTKTVNSSNLSVKAPSFALETPGNYRVTLRVNTTVGQKTNTTSCAKAFTIAKKDVCPYNPSLPPNSPDCQPCPENPEIWIKDEKCAAEIINSKTGMNLTQGNIDAASSVARAGDKLTYTITAKNSGLIGQNVTMVEELQDVLEYATLIDAGAGTFDSEAMTLTWPDVPVAPNQTQSRTFVVQLLAEIPLTNTGTSDNSSFDCRMVNTFGNSVEVNVECPEEKVIIEQTVSELPQTGPTENILFGSTLLAIVVFFYARSRQLGKEVKLIRRNVTTGVF